MAKVIVVLDYAEIDRIRFGWNGMVGRDLNRRLRTLEFRARGSVGVKTGRLRGNIRTWERSRTSQGLEGRVGAPLRYAAPHHQGAKPHVIRAKNGKALRFRMAGKVVFATSVHHPGNRPRYYLSRWLREAVR